MAINNLQDLALALKAAPGLTMSQIVALDPNSNLCKDPNAAIQMIKAAGYPLTVTTNTTDVPGAAAYKISA